MPNQSRLDEIVSPTNDKITTNKDPSLPYIGLEHIPTGGSAVLGSEPAANSVSTNAVFYRDDILFGKLRPNLRKALKATFSGYCSTDILVLRAKEGVSPDYASWLFRSEPVWAAAERSAIGTKMPRTSWDLLKNKNVFLPSTSEQETISHFLNTLDTQIRRTEELIAKLEQIKQGLLTDLLTRGIDENGELRPSPRADDTLYKNSELGPTPKDWNITTLGETSEIFSGSTPDRSTSSYWKGGTIPWVKTTEVSFSAIRETQEKITKRALEDVGLRLAPADTILVAMYGQGITRGRSAILKIPATTNQACAAIVADSNQISPEFLFLYLEAAYERLRDIGHGSNQTNLNAELLSQFKISIPPIKEQQLISSVMNEHERRMATERSSLQKLYRLKEALMDNLLTGQVRVTPLLDEAERAAG